MEGPERKENVVASVTKSVDVDVPVRTAYNQWTQFEEFPRFMEGVEEIRQVDPTHTHWKTRVGGVEREFEAEITEQHPDERVAWKSLSGPDQAGVVTFHRLNDDQARITVQLDWTPDNATEKVGDVLNADERRVQGDLERFKEFIEARGVESGAWRGDVD